MSVKRKAWVRRMSASTSTTAITQTQKGLSQAFDKRRYADLVLNPERMGMLRETGCKQTLVHGFKNHNTKLVHQIKRI